ncbi:hypothetical protein [Streptomyces sp. NPDC059349]|uniref:hypothetical protein n=1 Tax=Streptomyces sp. NPDC059349 TaxID=3346808 RepID=UPI0036CC8C1E
MSREQPPRPTEPTLAEFREFLINRAQESPEPGFWRSALQENITQLIVSLTDTYADGRHAGTIAACGDPDEDRDPLEFVRQLAEGYEQRQGDASALVQHLDGIARQLAPEDVRALRVAAEAVKKITPLIIRIAADEDGMTAAHIANDLGMTESYVYRTLRTHRENYDPQ